MDAFETARASAATLRSELREASRDDAGSIEVVEAAARHLELEVVWVDPDEPQLKGARACFDQQSGLILCASDGDTSERAMRVAHEIGHVRVHSRSAACTPADIDGSRSSEAAAIGLQRVEDYSGRERRELQANVFARELLLPRVSVVAKFEGRSIARTEGRRRSEREVGLRRVLVREDGGAVAAQLGA